ncbi:MAG: hypothetical protein DRI22_04820 [Caldiserica bacterium]|nr:MAG: hypothetical protein DRI22_04820 [Caldisericota bacterium]
MKYIVIHGHFYQPPRFDPWWEEVRLEESASPSPNWNERIFQECYLPNTQVWVKSPYGRMDRINNFRYISFNFGPTLLSWIVEKYPFFWKRILLANKYSISKLGSGNAIGMPYFHTILPLDSPRDRYTNILWGIEEFKFRFGYRPKGIWLPEVALNMDVIGDLIRFGMEFVLLTVNQVREVRKKGKRWKETNPEIFNPCRIYEIPYGKTRIKAFFSHPHLSNLISFGRILDDAIRTGELIEDLLKGDDKDFIVALTDGETFGHHHKNSHKGLAYLLKYVLPKKNIEPVNFSFLSSNFHTEWEVKIWDNSSWSCAHGIGRWMTDCGCGKESGFNQRWRAPLRKALQFLKDYSDMVYEEVGKRIFISPWDARNDYIKVILEPVRKEWFFKKHLKKRSKEIALKLLEMQRWSLSMFTSCAWFFHEISGIETVEVLTFALRVIRYIEEITGENIERKFLSYLEKAPSNIKEFKNGRGVWEKLVKFQEKRKEDIVSYLLLTYLFTGRDFYQRGRFFYNVKILNRIEDNTKVSFLGEMFVEDTITDEEDVFYFYAEKGKNIFLRISKEPFRSIKNIRSIKRERRGIVYSF